MLIDNKNVTKDQLISLWEFIKKYTKDGEFDLVSGYFSIPALALLYDNLKDVKKFRLVLGDIIADQRIQERTINLLAENIKIDAALNINQSARKAIDFLNQDNLRLKTVEPSFCHAKLYVHKADMSSSYYVLGSSNLTLAGLGLKKSSNVELNTAQLSANNDYEEVKKWFQQLWATTARDYTIIDEKQVNYKKYVIEQISQFYKKYSPEDLYYKTLFELFKDELPELEAESSFNLQIGHLKDTVLYKTLYPFQQSGVRSLIQKIQRYNGAILADAVGLGKTWQALGVMKYFELSGYKVVLLCPKKLEQNWRKYKQGHDSRFEADRLNYTIRYHTDLQDDRLETKGDKFLIKKFFQRNPKILFVIDESHNLRNDKSSRYQFLVNELLQKNTDVKMLLLSATPINNHLIDVRNQFKLLVKGKDNGFKDEPLKINSLESVFRIAQKEFREWQQLENPTIGQFIQNLSPKFFELTDALILARTRKQIAGQTDDLVFPKKLVPQNEYLELGRVGKLRSFGSLLDAMRIYMSAYRPTEFTDAEKAANVLEDNMQREMFLVKMMYILLVKRFESSWFSFSKTVDNIYNHHVNALEKVNKYLETKENQDLENDLSPDDEDLEDAAILVEAQSLTDDSLKNNSGNPLEATLGKKRPIRLSEIVQMDKFKKYLEEDIAQLEYLRTQLKSFATTFERELESKDKRKSKDVKLQRLMEIIDTKQQSGNKKVVIFTAYTDTAKYLYGQLNARGFENLGLVTGSFCDTTAKIPFKKSNFEPLLEAFAPYTKLYMEHNWEYYYERDKIPPFKGKEQFEDWQKYIKTKDKEARALLNNPIDILIATDCISEGQNLQDCDMVVNYDIHWNPVRLIQRFGRIDRIGSPNDEIQGINFWPGKSYDAYLNLKSRVEDRMALFGLVGSEYDPKMTPELEQKVKDNPLIDKQTQKMIDQLQTTWEDIDDNTGSMGLDKLSLEEFRQELSDFFQQHKERLEKIPNGVYTGFKHKKDLFNPNLPQGTIALMRYNPDDEDLLREHRLKKKDSTDEYHLLYTTPEGTSSFINQHDILKILRYHKKEKRTVAKPIDNGDEDATQAISEQIKLWMDEKAGRQAVSEIQDLFNFGIDTTKKEKSKDDLLLEKKFQNNNFELITWFVVS